MSPVVPPYHPSEHFKTDEYREIARLNRGCCQTRKCRRHRLLPVLFHMVPLLRFLFLLRPWLLLGLSLGCIHLLNLRLLGIWRVMSHQELHQKFRSTATSADSFTETEEAMPCQRPLDLCYPWHNKEETTSRLQTNSSR